MDYGSSDEDWDRYEEKQRRHSGLSVSSSKSRSKRQGSLNKKASTNKGSPSNRLVGALGQIRGRNSRLGRDDHDSSRSTHSTRSTGSSRATGRDLSRVQVMVRIRPLLDYEKKSGNEMCCRVVGNNTVEVTKLDENGETTTNTYKFDAAMPQSHTQVDVFERTNIKHLMTKTFEGYACTVLAYGMTGSGKTFTMSGLDEKASVGNRVNSETTQGLMFRSFRHSFKMLNQLKKKHSNISYIMRVSALEIYNENVRDLLNPTSVTPSERGGEGKKGGKKTHLMIRQSPVRGFFVQNLTHIEVENLEDLMEVAWEAHGNRAVGAHELNTDSSRSHAIITLEIESQLGTDHAGAELIRVGKLSFVDLAGSENLKASKSVGAAAKETASINKSLFTLGSVIQALGDIATGKKTCFAPRTVQGQRYHKAAVRFLRRERHDSDDRVPVPCFPALFRERPDLAVRLAHPQHQEQACGDHQPKGPASAGSAPQPSKAQGLLREPPVHLPQRKHPCAFPS
mmetsp:Transcript_43576/g.85327  ORF Transcript_43576/g.85327 Transcript_43576/m.85327 type:complete len:510 (+) Transcript_43576:214-1743(+)